MNIPINDATNSITQPTIIQKISGPPEPPSTKKMRLISRKK